VSALARGQGYEERLTAVQDVLREYGAGCKIHVTDVRADRHDRSRLHLFISIHNSGTRWLLLELGVPAERCEECTVVLCLGRFLRAARRIPITGREKGDAPRGVRARAGVPGRGRQRFEVSRSRVCWVRSLWG